jgi:hypothetical protein
MSCYTWFIIGRIISYHVTSVDHGNEFERIWKEELMAGICPDGLWKPQNI